MKFIRITKSNRTGKKLMASIETDNNRILNIHFGAKGYGDYPYYHMNEGVSYANMKKKAYIARHRVREDWNNPISAGALSRWILWNKSTIDASIIDYRKRFDL